MHKFFIFGDSHAGTLMRAARAVNADFAGGSVMAGGYMNDYFCEVKNGTFAIHIEMGQRRLSKRLHDGGFADNLLSVDLPVLTTVGFNSNNFAFGFLEKNLAIKGSSGDQFITAACFQATVTGARRGALAFYRLLREAEKTVFAVRSPQRFSMEEAPVARAFEDVMVEEVTRLGVGVIDVRAETTDQNEVLLPKFCGDDRIHGNDAFGLTVIAAFNAAMAAQAL